MGATHPFSTHVPILYPPENIRKPPVSDVFKGYRSGTLVENVLNQTFFFGVLKVFKL